MFGFTKQVLIVLLNFSGSLTRKCVPLNKKLCTTRPIVTDLNPIELDYYPFMISIEKAMKAVILLTIHLQKYVFEIKKNMWMLK